jgi:2'-5' RNA ligase
VKLFAAIVPPQAAVDELAAAARPLHALPQAAALRWTGLPTWHLTVGFFGQVQAGTLAELEAGLARAAAGQPEFELRLGGGGHFDGRALWAGIDGGAGPLDRLAAAVADAARHAGIAVEDRRFHGHLTLARSGVPRGSGRGAARSGGPDLRPLAAALGDFRGGAWPAGPLRLMRSHPGAGAGAARYESLAAWPLTG